MDKLRGMETFIAVVECGSFTGAASRLGLSAVMVGKYIAQLESQLATRLLGVTPDARASPTPGESILTKRNG